MAFVRLLKDLMRDPAIGARFVPVIPDEARTFGMDSLFPTAKIYSPHGQTYEAVDRALLLSYKESERGQILHEGISESGAMGSVIAAGTSYATHGTPMIPAYVFYTIFGWQKPCYLLGEGYAGSFKALMEETAWEQYGTGNYEKCANCMVHCGYEATAVADAVKKPWKAPTEPVARSTAEPSLALMSAATWSSTAASIWLATVRCQTRV